MDAVRVPVTVKVRAGWDYSLFAAPELAKRFEGVGAKMLTLHARFAKQGFEGEADWRLIEQLRKAVTIPLIGNGDVKTPEDATRMLHETGCDGVMVGRAAISNPWALARIRAGIVGEAIPDPPTFRDRVETCLEHCRLMIAAEAEVESLDEARNRGDFEQVEGRAIRALRGQLPLYIKGEPGASAVRARLTTCSTLEEVEHILAGMATAAAGCKAPTN